VAAGMVAVCNPGTRRGVAEGLVQGFRNEKRAWPLVQVNGGCPMNRIIYIIGLIVVVLAILAFLGLR
jgi:hypothetical protein